MEAMANELAAARAQILRLATDQQELRQQAMQAIAASEARTTTAIAQLTARDARSDDRLELVDFKVVAPENFHGKREESWKVWSRQFRT